MALTKSAQTGRSFLDGFLAKLPESLRADGQALIAKLGAAPEAEIEPALQFVGDGALARPDYSKAMNDLKTQTDALEADRQQLEDHRTQLNDWWTDNEAALKDYRKIKEGNPPANPPVVSPANPLANIAEELELRDRAHAGVLAVTLSMSQRHLQMFGEVLDMAELMSDPRLAQPIKGQPGRVFGIQDAYNAKHGERVAVKAKEAEDARINKIVEERLAEERKKNPVSQPFPVRGVEPSPLDVLTVKDGSAQHTLDSAVAEYERLQAARATG